MPTKFENAIALLNDPSTKIIKKVGGRWQQEQVDYIEAVADLLKGKKLALIEAETGIGKSLGYLLPSLLWMACNRKSLPIVISTHTRALQRQIIEKDVVICQKVIELLGFPMPKVAFRMGKQAFFSVSQCENAIKKIDPLLANKDSKKFLSNVTVVCETGTGLWQDYLDNYGDFPDGISSDDVCLTEYGIVDNPAYLNHLALAQDADVLVTNHATVLNRYALSNQKFHALILDEGHEMTEVCELFANHRTQVKKILSLLIATGLRNKTTKDAIEKTEDMLVQLQDLDKKLGGSVNVLSDLSHFTTLSNVSEQVKQVSESAGKVLKLYRSKLDESNLTHEQAKTIDGLIEVNSTLDSFVQNNQYKRRAVMYSQLNRYPSIASISVNAGYLFASRLADLTDKLLITSATIADINQQQTSFRTICYGLAIDHNNIDIAMKLAPKNYGTMTFVQVDKATPKPILGFEEVAELNPVWLDNTALMIKQAAKTGVTLVLTQSFQEAQLLGKRLADEKGVIVHSSSQKASEVINSFSSTASKGINKVLITPSAWQGVSFHNTEKGGQLLNNLVITRVPYKPVSDESVQLMVERLVARNKTPQQARAILGVRSLQDAVTKLKQGLGRGIRSPNDVIKVWLCDPRITMINKSTKTGLINAIPKRFVDSFFDADIFSAKHAEKVVPKNQTAQPFYL